MGLEQAAAEEAAFALLSLAARIRLLAEVDWHSPAALLYRTCVHDIAEDCGALRNRLAAHIPREP